MLLVTGGAGFIGSHLAEALVRRGETVRVVDSLVTGKRQNLAHLPDVEFLHGDLADADVAREAVRGVDYVLHQAAIPSVPRSVDDPRPSKVRQAPPVGIPVAIRYLCRDGLHQATPDRRAIAWLLDRVGLAGKTPHGARPNRAATVHADQATVRRGQRR